MANLNKVLLIGRLTRDPETRATQSGSSVVSFGLAVNRSYTRKESGEKVEETCFVDCEAWGRTGETIARYLRKGRQMFVEGRLKFDSWEREGQRRSKLSVVVDGFQFLDSMSSGGGGGGGGGGGREWSGKGSEDREAVGTRSTGAPETTPQDDYGEPGAAPLEDIPF